jgi:hypothetical protein
MRSLLVEVPVYFCTVKQRCRKEEQHVGAVVKVQICQSESVETACLPLWRPCGGGVSRPWIGNSNCADCRTFSLGSTPDVARPVASLELMAANRSWI